jgi:hypothetical protein
MKIWRSPSSINGCWMRLTSMNGKCSDQMVSLGDEMASQTEVKINWRDFPQPTMTEEQLRQFEDFLLENINQVFEHDFEDWSENYREAVQGKS